MHDDPTPENPEPLTADDRLRAAGRAMHDAGLPAPELPLPVMAGLMEQFGGRWQFTFDDDVCAWIAVKRPTPAAQHVIAAFTLAELSAKLTCAEAGMIP